ncbi:hypothetical protein BU17DRAFT_78130 [Hysterangium stoloniferum]|nr:hypothetical protein BU17DRAFT_78130 [Hysterangium stoloniferum]
MDDKTYKKALRKHLKQKRPLPDHEWTPFRAAEKQYKAKFPPPDLSGVLDLWPRDRDNETHLLKNEPIGNPMAVDTKSIGLNGVKQTWTKAYTIPQIPGLVIIPNYLSHEEQRELIRWSLCNQARQPNETNLDIHYHLPSAGLWNTHVLACNSESDVGSDENCYIVRPKRPTGPEPPVYSPDGPRPLIDNAPLDISHFEDVYSQPKSIPPPSLHLPPTHASKLLYKLRWANIGYYYHWGSKSYDFTKPKTEYPQYVRRICKDVVRSIEWRQLWEGTPAEEWGDYAPDWESWPETYEPDAGIVNFYQPKDTLCGHVDRSEMCATSPLVSISLGNAAIFLIGGNTRSVRPVPIILRSGDIVIMSGPGCRRAYHGVPRILEGTLPDHLRSHEQGGGWDPYEKYMETTRINVNVRQVFPRDFDPLAQGNNS